MAGVWTLIGSLRLRDERLPPRVWSNPRCALEEVGYLCPCTWYRFENIMQYVIRIQHGDNPEQSLQMNREDLGIIQCDRGHDMELCLWIAEVVRINHIDACSSSDGATLDYEAEGRSMYS